jgi:hypothetical protein
MIINIPVNSILLFWLSHLKTLIYMSDYIDKNPDTLILLFKSYKHFNFYYIFYIQLFKKDNNKIRLSYNKHLFFIIVFELKIFHIFTEDILNIYSLKI